MGYFKNLEIESQQPFDDDVADTIAWYRAHQESLPPELMRAILTDEAFFQKALTVWRNEIIEPVPARKHVALQVARRDLRPTKVPNLCLIGWSLIMLAFVAAASVIGVML